MVGAAMGSGDGFARRCDDVRRLMKAGETLWASDHRALVVNFRCA
jgi:hypothetical protein